MLAPWPGNVRQLLNVVEQAAALSPAPAVSEALIQEVLRHRPEEITPLAQAQREFERDYLVDLLQATAGNVTRAARLAKRNRTEFYRLLRRHELEPELFRRS